MLSWQVGISLTMPVVPIHFIHRVRSRDTIVAGHLSWRHKIHVSQLPMGDTVWSQFLGAHEITDRDTVSYLRQGQHLCPEHTAGWKLAGPIWRARWGECRPCRPHGGWMTVLCDSSLQFYWHRHTYIYTFTYDELTCICWLGRRSTNRILHMPQSKYMFGNE